MARRYRPSFHQLVALEELAKLREAAGYNQRAADLALGWGRGMVSRYELGAKDLQAKELTAMLRLYEVKDQQTTARLHRLRGIYLDEQFWNGHNWVTPEYDRYMICEQAALEISVSQGVQMPGLLQTYGYSLDISRIISPIRDPQLWHEQAEVRRLRQEVLLRKGEKRVIYRAFIAQGLLSQGKPAILRDQLDHLREVAELSNVSIRVLPSGAGIPVYGCDLLKLPYGRELATTSLPDTTFTLAEERQLRNAKHFLERYEEEALSDEDSIAVIDKKRLEFA